MADLNRNSTVYSRMKKNGGYLSGPEHRLLNGPREEPDPPGSLDMEDLYGPRARRADPELGEEIDNEDEDENDENGDEEDENGNGTAVKAPNYRESEGVQMCKRCNHFDEGEDKSCRLYQFHARPYFVCDSFAPAGSADYTDQETATNDQTVQPRGV